MIFCSTLFTIIFSFYVVIAKLCDLCGKILQTVIFYNLCHVYLLCITNQKPESSRGILKFKVHRNDLNVKVCVVCITLCLIANIYNFVSFAHSCTA